MILEGILIADVCLLVLIFINLSIPKRIWGQEGIL